MKLRNFSLLPKRLTFLLGFTSLKRFLFFAFLEKITPSVKLSNLLILSADAHVKIYLLAAGKRVKKRKTSVRKGTLNPVFNEALSFDIAADALNTVDLMLSVLHENEIIGCISIGSHATGQELNHWREVRTANKPIARWHSLQDPKNFF